MNLAIIPARGGSKGLKDKNIVWLRDKPLIIYTIEAALDSKLFDSIVVTTDSYEIGNVCVSYNLSVVVRTPELGKDDVPLAPVIIDALVQAERRYQETFNTIFTLQPTSPLRDAKHIQEAYGRFISLKADSLLSVTEELHSLWILENGYGKALKVSKVNRQWVKPAYIGNGAIFITRRDILLANQDRLGGKIGIYLMNTVDSIDIHTQEDIDLASYYIQRKRA